MKIELLQDNLKGTLAIAGRVSKERTSLPVLSNVLLKTDNGGLQVAACDLTTSITVRVGGKVEEEGGITLNAKRLSEVVGLMPVEPITITSDDKKLEATVKGRKSRTSIKGLDAGEFPVIPTLAHAQILFSVLASDLLKAFKAVSFSMSPDASAPALNATYLSLSGPCLTFATSDRFRLSEYKMRVKYEGGDHTMLIPFDGVGHIERVLAKLAESATEVQVAITQHNNQIVIGTDDLQVGVQLVDAKFFDYARMIPKKFDTKITAGIADLSLAIRQVGVVVEDGWGIKIDFKPDSAAVTGQSRERGDDSDSDVSIVLDGNPKAVELNHRYLLPVLSALDSVQCSIQMQSGVAPIIIRGVGDDNALYVVAPFNK